MDLWSAKRSVYDRAVHQILRLVDGACDTKVNQSKPPIVFGIGSANVKGSGNHFLRYFIEKLRALGYEHIYYVNEFYTSKKCCHCGSDTELVKDTHYRVKKCDSEQCGERYFHRDTLAGHNIAHA